MSTLLIERRASHQRSSRTVIMSVDKFLEFVERLDKKKVAYLKRKIIKGEKITTPVIEYDTFGDDVEYIDGLHRVKAMKELGITDIKVEVIN